MASGLERCSDSKLLQNHSELSPECSSISYPGNHVTKVSAPLAPLHDTSHLTTCDDVAIATVSYSEVVEHKISSLILESSSLQEDKPLEAISLLSKAIALDRSNSRLYELRARVYLVCGDFPSSIVNLRRAICLLQKDPDQSSVFTEVSSLLCSVYFVYSQCLYDLGCYQEALDVLQVSSWLHNFSLQFNLRRIMCLSALGGYDKCLEVINFSINTHGHLPDLLIMRSRINYMFGNLSQCYYDVTNVLYYHGDNLEADRLRQQLEQQANITRGQAIDYYLEGKKSESLKKITAAIDTDPATGDYHVFRGVLLRLMANYTSAIDELLVAMDKCHHNVSSSTYQNASRQLLLTINDFAVYCYRQGQYTDAVTLLNKVIAEHQHEQGLYINRGDCFYRLRKLHYALSDYQQAHEVAGDRSNQTIAVRIAQVAYELGKTSFNNDDKELAVQQLSLAIKHCPQVAAFYTARARAYYALQDVPTAQRDLITSLKLGENDQNCYSILARLFPGQTSPDILSHHTSVNAPVDCTRCSPRITVHRSFTPPLQKEVDIPRQWELLSRPLPPIKGKTEWSSEERQFHYEINHIKRKVTKQVEDTLTELSSFPPRSPHIRSPIKH